MFMSYVYIRGDMGENMASLSRQYDIYLGPWRNDGAGLPKLGMTDLETNYSYYRSEVLPVGLCFSTDG